MLFKVLWGSMLTVLSWAVNLVIDKCDVTLVTSDTPQGTRIGGHNVPQVTDKYLVIVFAFNGKTVWTGYWQAS